MAKRNAEKELTDRNWDQEDEAEEVKSSFSKNDFLFLLPFKFILGFLMKICDRTKRPF